MRCKIFIIVCKLVLPLTQSHPSLLVKTKLATFLVVSAHSELRQQTNLKLH